MTATITHPGARSTTGPAARPLTLAGRLAVLVLIPLLLAALSAESESAGLAAAVQAGVCARGAGPLAALFAAEAVLLAGATAAAYFLGSRRHWAAVTLRQYGWLALSLLALIAAPFLIAWQTDSSVCVRGQAFFWQSIFIEAFILASLAISYNLVFGFAGVLSFGHAAFFGLGAYTVGLLMLHLEWPLLPAVIAALLISLLTGLLVSVVALRIHGLYFAIFTLTFAEIFYVLAQNRIMADITGAEDGFTFAVPDWINATQNRLTFYYLALLFLVICYLLVRQLMNSPAGRVLHAIRDNENRALSLGFNTFAYKTMAIVLGGVLASGAGVLRALLNKGASPNVLSSTFTIDPLLMTLIGGVGTFNGPVIGAFLLRMVEYALRDSVITLGSFELNIGEHWFLILGTLFILIVIAFPSGITGTLRDWWRSRRQPLQKRAAAAGRDH